MTKFGLLAMVILLVVVLADLYLLAALFAAVLKAEGVPQFVNYLFAYSVKKNLVVRFQAVTFVSQTVS